MTRGDGCSTTSDRTAGRFYGVGVGPGDPELTTLKAARLIAEAEVIAYHSGVGKESNARRIAAALIPADVVEENLVYPVTTGLTDHPGGYAGAMAAFYEQSADRLAAHLDAGRTVVLLAEGDPLFYGSYMYMHDRLSERFETEIVPGVPSFAAATASVAAPLVRQTDVLTILPGTLPEPELARRLADTQGAVIMKLGRTFPKVRSALAQAGRLEHAMYVERASMPGQRWLPVAEVDPETVPYFSLIVVPGDSVASEPTGRRVSAALDQRWSSSEERADGRRVSAALD
ncbi:MAG: precorrin-2 C(20)-methyltransferase, partial [Marmoricola sp.]